MRPDSASQVKEAATAAAADLTEDDEAYETTEQEEPAEDPEPIASAVNATILSQTSMFTKQASVFMATGSATEDGGIILAHNTSAFYPEANFANIWIDINPFDGQRMTMQAEPGRISSFGEVYATRTLLVANTRIKGFNVYAETGVPEFQRVRQAVQYCKTLDAFAEAMTKGSGGGLASTWLVGEFATSEIMKLEVGFSFNSLEKLTDGFFVSANGVDDTRILNAETESSSLPDTRKSTGARTMRLADLIEPYLGTLTPEDAKIIISDHFDVYLSRVSASSRGVCAHYEDDDARYADSLEMLPNMPFGTVDAKVTSTELFKDKTFLARWGSACGRAFDSGYYLRQNPQFEALSDYLYDRPSHFWNQMYPLDA